MDPKARELMARMTFSPNKNPEYGGDIFTVRKKSGEERAFYGGPVKLMTHEELRAKYYRIAEFSHVDKAQADRAIEQWLNLKSVKDIGDAIQTVAKFGQARPQLTKKFGRTVALAGLSMTVPRGEVFGFLGPNGAGKTTAVKLLLGLLKPTSGQGSLLGKPIGDLGTRRHIGYASSNMAIGFLRYLRKSGYSWPVLTLYKLVVTLDAPVQVIGKGLQYLWRRLRGRNQRTSGFESDVSQGTGLAPVGVQTRELQLLL